MSTPTAPAGTLLSRWSRLPGAGWFTPAGWMGDAFEMTTTDELISALRSAGVPCGRVQTGDARSSVAEAAAVEAEAPHFGSRHQPLPAAAAPAAAGVVAGGGADPAAAAAFDSDTSDVGAPVFCDDATLLQQAPLAAVGAALPKRAAWVMRLSRPCDAPPPADDATPTLHNACRDIAESVAAFPAPASSSPAGQHSWLPPADKAMCVISGPNTQKSISEMSLEARARVADDLHAAGARLLLLPRGGGESACVARLTGLNAGGDTMLYVNSPLVDKLLKEYDDAVASGRPPQHALEALRIGVQQWHADNEGDPFCKFIIAVATGAQARAVAGTMALHAAHVPGVFGVENPAAWGVVFSGPMLAMGKCAATGVYMSHRPAWLPQGPEPGFRLALQARGKGPTGSRFAMPVRHWPRFSYTLEEYAGTWEWRAPAGLDMGDTEFPCTIPMPDVDGAPVLAVGVPRLGGGGYAWGCSHGSNSPFVAAARTTLVSGLLAGTLFGQPLASQPREGAGMSVGSRLHGARQGTKYASARGAIDALGVHWEAANSSQAGAKRTAIELPAGFLAASLFGPLEDHHSEGIGAGLALTGQRLHSMRCSRIGEFKRSRAPLDVFGVTWQSDESNQAKAKRTRVKMPASLMAGTLFGLSLENVPRASPGSALGPILYKLGVDLGNTRGNGDHPLSRAAFDALGLAWRVL